MADYAASKMTEHVLNHPKGWFDGHALDISAKLSANVTFSVPEGRVAHLNSAGEFEMGIADTDMAIFLLHPSRAPSVQNPSHTAAGSFKQQPVFPAKKMTGLVATGGYELESSEFDGTQDYPPNALLTAPADNTDADVGGVLTPENAVQYEDAVCACVSRGKFKTEHGTEVVAFWPIYLPAAA